MYEHFQFSDVFVVVFIKKITFNFLSFDLELCLPNGIDEGGIIHTINFSLDIKVT